MPNITAASDPGPISKPFSSLLMKIAGNFQPMNKSSGQSDVGSNSLCNPTATVPSFKIVGLGTRYEMW